MKINETEFRNYLIQSNRLPEKPLIQAAFFIHVPPAVKRLFSSSDMPPEIYLPTVTSKDPSKTFFLLRFGIPSSSYLHHTSIWCYEFCQKLRTVSTFALMGI